MTPPRIVKLQKWSRRCGQRMHRCDLTFAINRFSIGSRCTMTQETFVTNGYIEELPPQCPPADASDPDGNTVYYRVCPSFPPDDGHFMSQRHNKPQATFRNVDECVARSVSLNRDPKRCQQLKCFPTAEKHVIVAIRIPRACGKVKQTGRTPTHYSWWRPNGVQLHRVCFEHNGSDSDNP